MGHGGRILYDNSLEERLKLLESASLPKLRASIFGYLFCLNLTNIVVNRRRGSFLISFYSLDFPLINGNSTVCGSVDSRRRTSSCI